MAAEEDVTGCFEADGFGAEGVDGAEDLTPINLSSLAEAALIPVAAFSALDCAELNLELAVEKLCAVLPTGVAPNLDFVKSL